MNLTNDNLVFDIPPVAPATEPSGRAEIGVDGAGFVQLASESAYVEQVIDDEKAQVWAALKDGSAGIDYEVIAGKFVVRDRVTNAIVFEASTNGLKFGDSATGTATATLGTNSPASETTPYCWLSAIAPDGTPVVIPAFKL